MAYGYGGYIFSDSSFPYSATTVRNNKFKIGDIVQHKYYNQIIVRISNIFCNTIEGTVIKKDNSKRGETLTMSIEDVVFLGKKLTT